MRFNNDYNHGGHPALIKALADTNDNSYSGYGTDEICEAAKQEIKKYLDCPEANIHFIVSGTQINFLTLRASLARPYQGVISPDTGHICVHEAGAVENTGHKVIALPSKDGKITAEQIEKEYLTYKNDPMIDHITEPKTVYISFPTEYGTLYSKQELEDISRVCKEGGLKLFIDGARMGYGLAAEDNDVTLADLARLSDAFTIGGTKCGLLFGEALVVTDDEINCGYRKLMKMNGALLAKGWLLGLQYYTMFKDGLYFEITKSAIEYAVRIKKAFAKKGIKEFIASPTNQTFVELNDEQLAKLDENFIGDDSGKTADGKTIMRYCTSWSTKPEEADALVAAIEAL